VKTRRALRPSNVGPHLRMRIKRFPRTYAALRCLNRVLRTPSKIYRMLFGTRNARAFRYWQDYLAVQPIAGYIGWLGHANLGDEALYLSFEKLFPQFRLVSYDDTHSIELFVYKHLVKRQKFYDFVFLGGGTLINLRNYYYHFRDVVRSGNCGVVFGTGVLDPSFWQEHYPDIDWSQEMVEWVAVLKEAAYVGVRGPRSARLLESAGLPKPLVIGDPALSLCTPKPPQHLTKRKVAINLGHSSRMWGCQEHVNEIIATLARQLLETGWQVEFLPVHPIDFRIIRNLVRRFNLQEVSIWQEFGNVQKTVNRIRSYDLVIGQRLHSIVLAHGCGVPAIALEYQPKCADFMESMGTQHFSVRTNALELDRLTTLIQEIEADYIGHCRHLISKGNSYRHLQRKAAVEVVDLVQKQKKLLDDVGDDLLPEKRSDYYESTKARDEQKEDSR
jgi:hypothetical protein